MSTPKTPAQGESAATVPANSQPSEAQAQGGRGEEVTVMIKDIRASGLPARVGLFSGVFYVRVKGGRVPRKTKTAKYKRGESDEFVASWDDTIELSGFESSKVEIEVYARRFFFSYKVIKRTESKESLADLLEQVETPVELELLEEGQAAGKLVFKISRRASGLGTAAGVAAHVETPPADSDAPPQASSIPASPKES